MNEWQTETSKPHVSLKLRGPFTELWCETLIQRLRTLVRSLESLQHNVIPSASLQFFFLLQFCFEVSSGPESKLSFIEFVTVRASQKNEKLGMAAPNQRLRFHISMSVK